MHPDTRYAQTADGAFVAYQVVGNGPIDIVFAPGWFSNIDLIWEQPEIAPALEGLASRWRLIVFDRRGTGLSDPVADAIGLETMMDDVGAVMDAAGSAKAVLAGLTISTGLISVFAATFPERVLGLVLIHANARTAWAEDYPWGEALEYHREETDRIAQGWGTGEFERWFLKEQFGDARADDPRFVSATARYLRQSLTRGQAVLQNRIWYEMDYRDVLPAIHVPTLVVDRRADPAHARHVASLIPGAELVHLPGEPRLPWVPGTDRTVREIDRFLDTLQQEQAELERVLATVLFTDIVGSTDRVAAAGDVGWRQIVSEHDRIVRAHLARYRGREIKTMGDGFLATFDGPARAIRCAAAIARSVEQAGIQVRCGLHTGEIDTGGDDVSGIAVAIASRVMSLAGPGEVLVSGTVRDLVAGSGLEFEDRGEHALKGVPGMWRLFAVERADARAARPDPRKPP